MYSCMQNSIVPVVKQVQVQLSCVHHALQPLDLELLQAEACLYLLSDALLYDNQGL